MFAIVAAAVFSHWLLVAAKSAVEIYEKTGSPPASARIAAMMAINAYVLAAFVDKTCKLII